MPALNTVRKTMAPSITKDHQTFFSFGQIFSQDQESSPITEFLETRNGFTNPYWREQIKAGIQAGTSYSLEATRLVTREPGLSEVIVTPDLNQPDNFWVKTRQETTDAGLGIVGFHSPVDTIKADNQALTRLRFNIRDQSEHMNALITIGEGRETLRQMRKPYASIREAVSNYADASSSKIDALRRRRGRSLSRRAKAREVRSVLADTWLETTFGVLPTMSDVKEASETLARLYEGNADKRSKLAGRCVVANRAINIYPGLFNSSVYYTAVETNETELGVHYRCGIAERTYSDFIGWQRLGHLAGFRLGNFVPTLYELVPFSWLADYVTTLGEALTANQVDLTDVTWVVRSEKTVTQFTRKYPIDWAMTSAHYGPSLRSQRGSSLGETVVSRTNMSRSLLTSDTLPSVLPRVRSLSEAYKPIRAGNVLAIVFGKVKRLDKSINLYLLKG